MKNFFASLRRTLTKISVFYQILFIIILMVGFMVWQSISSNKAMDMIQKNTKTIYDNTAAISASKTASILSSKWKESAGNIWPYWLVNLMGGQHPKAT